MDIIPYLAIKMSFKDITGALRRSRSAYKGKITMILNVLNEKSEAQSNFLLKQETTVNTYLHKIDRINDDIHEWVTVNSYPCQLAPCQLVPMSTRTHVNSYHQ